MAYLCERLSFDTLFRLSEPKRVARSATVRSKQTPVLGQVSANQDEAAYTFRFRSYPSTTGRTHRGFIRFFRPRNPRTPLEKLDCEIDCACPDYRYRWAWANKQRGSSRVGPRSLNQAWNRAPRITNPTARPGLCKHLLALRDHLYGQMVRFAAARPRAEEEAPVSGEEHMQNLVKELNRQAQWRLAQRRHREREAAATHAAALAAAPVVPVGPAMQRTVATRFIRPESLDSVVRGMKSLLEERKLVQGLLREAEGAVEVDDDDAGPGFGLEAAEPEVSDESEIVALLRDILAAIVRLGGDEEGPGEEGEEVEEPIIPDDAEEVEAGEMPDQTEA